MLPSAGSGNVNVRVGRAGDNVNVAGGNITSTTYNAPKGEIWSKSLFNTIEDNLASHRLVVCITYIYCLQPTVLLILEQLKRNLEGQFTTRWASPNMNGNFDLNQQKTKRLGHTGLRSKLSEKKYET